MSKTLSILLIISMIFFFIYVLFQIKKNKLTVKNALIWLIMAVSIILCVLSIEHIKVIAQIAGIEKASNMIFFMGFIFLIFTCFNLSQSVSVQNRKIVILTQELALLRKEYENERKK